MVRLIGSVLACVLFLGCGPGARNNGDDDDDASGPCTAGQLHCDGTELQTCVDGSYQDSMQCPMACSDTVGCAICVPGQATCSGDVAHTCNSEGSGYYDETCDVLEGETCDPNGGCQGACSASSLGQSYIGCEYYPTVTGNVVGDAFPFAVAISNSGGTVANLTIDGGALTSPITTQVQPGTVLVQNLPWQLALKMCNDSDTPESPGCDDAPVTSPGIVTKGAYHLRADQPITVYQFNSLEYSIDGGTDFSFTNDASLMLPTNVWRDQYYTAAWDIIDGAEYPSELAVTAMTDGTSVTLTSPVAADAGPGLGALSPGTPETITLDAGDVVEVTSNSGDLTGTLIQSTSPVQVIGGHYCADVTTSQGACDHLEESMFGVETLGETYVVNAPAVTTIPAGKVEVIRVIATEANTTLTYDPAQPGAPTTIPTAGAFVELDDNANSFEITSSSKVMVVQYMEGESAGGNTGDPAMALAVPVEQFRTSYSFHAPISYESNYVDVTAPTGATVTLDGAPVTLSPIGDTGWQLGRVEALSTGPAGDGNHSITGSMPFGITVYGYGQYTSYWYPGGLNLTTVIE